MTRPGLWHLTAGPLAWALHFLLCYVTAAVYCAKAAGVASLGGARIALWLYTAAALAVIAAFGWGGWRAHRAGAADRSRFLGLVTCLLCALSAVAVAYTALAIAVIGTCR